MVPVALRYSPVTNPTGARATVYDHGKNVYGIDKTTAFALRLYDNVGVEFGLAALNAGTITPTQFLNLNQNIGGDDPNDNYVVARTVGDAGAMTRAQQSGLQLGGGGGLASIPVFDIQGRHVGAVAARQDHRRQAGGCGGRMLVERNRFHRRGADAQQHAEHAVQHALPELDLPAPGSGGPAAANIPKCTLKPVTMADYAVTFSAAETARLSTVCPSGVCDWTSQGNHTGVVPHASFGPSPANLLFDVTKSSAPPSSGQRKRAARGITIFGASLPRRAVPFAVQRPSARAWAMRRSSGTQVAPITIALSEIPVGCSTPNGPLLPARLIT